MLERSIKFGHDALLNALEWLQKRGPALKPGPLQKIDEDEKSKFS